MKIKNSHLLFRGLWLPLLLFLSGCSQWDLGLRWADTVLAYRINSAFDFESSQKKVVKEESRELVSRVRKTELPKWAAYFNETASQFETLDWNQPAATSLWLESRISALESYQKQLPQLLSPFALKVAGLVRKKNWEHFQSEFEAENQKIARQSGQCAEKMQSTLKDWLGPLSDLQKKTVRTYCSIRDNSAEVRITNRRHQISLFKAGLPDEFTTESFVKATRDWLISYEGRQHPEQKDLWTRSRPALIAMMAEVLQNSNERQRKEFHENLLEKAGTFQRLSL